MSSKNKTKLICLVISMVSLLSPIIVQAEDSVKINDLIEHAKAYDNQEILVEGEAIGEPLNRGEYTWVNINDGSNAIGIWMSSEEAEEIHRYGNYKMKGDVIKVQGIFHRACVEHGGEADIHNISYTISQEGNEVVHKLSYTKMISCLVLLVIVSLLFCQVKKRRIR